MSPGRTAPQQLDAAGEHHHPRAARLDPTRDDALRDAALELVAEVGYDRLTIDMVAARAGAGKATVYRRWANKAQLVADALAQRQAEHVVEDTGSLRGDLAALRGYLMAGGDSPFKARLIAGMVSALLSDSELRDALRTYASPPERSMTTIIDRAVARGEISAPRHPTVLAALLPALGLHRLIVTGDGADVAYLDAVLDTIERTLQADGGAIDTGG